MWCYQGNDWLVRDLDAPHVAREAATVEFPPTLRAGYDDLADGVVKVVGVSDDADAIAAALDALRATFAGTVAASTVAAVLPRRHAPRREQGGRDRLPRHRPRYRARGDRRDRRRPERPLDVRGCGLSIAMANASDPVRLGADEVTRSNDEDGFALAMERFVLDA